MIDSGLKRSLDDDRDAGALVKRAKTGNGGGELVVAGKDSKIKQVRLDSIDIYTFQSIMFPIIPINPTNHTPNRLPDAQGPKRTSALADPIMLLTGHRDQVFCLEFSPEGDIIASGSHDKSIFLWKTYGECENFGVLSGHKNAVLDLHWFPDGERLISCSPDKTVRAWDALTGEQLKKMSEHTEIINACATLRRGPPLLVSCSDDRSSKLWDLRTKRSIRTIKEKYQITSVEFSEAGDQIYTAGIENVVKAWDLRRTDQPSLSLSGHSDTITGMKLSPEGTHLLTNAMDNTLRSWDVRPYGPENRCEHMFVGHTHTIEKNLLRCDWSPDGKRVIAGSGDCMVNIWDVSSGQLQYRLPGHNGSVNGVAFHPKEPIVASASSDKQIYMGELAE
jgi:Prp8 binding protein